MGTRLYVGNISWNTTEDDLRSAFGTGDRNVTDCHIVMDRETGRSRGFAFVEMGSDDEAKAAIDELNGTSLDGRELRVNEARERENRGGSGSKRRGCVSSITWKRGREDRYYRNGAADVGSITWLRLAY